MGAAARDFVFNELHERDRFQANYPHDDERFVFLDGSCVCIKRKTMSKATLLLFRTDLYRWRRRRFADRFWGRVAWLRRAYYYRMGNARACAPYIFE